MQKHRGRVGLVLGAGGPVGHAFHAGLLKALEQTFAWDPRDADLIVGTSAGAQVGALVRAGLSTDDLAARASGTVLSESGREIARHFLRPNHKEPHPDEPRRYLPASPAYLGRLLSRPELWKPGRIWSALCPEGRVRLDEQSAGLRRLFGREWPERALWIPAVHLESGDRVVFGAPGAPAIDVGTAVSCSGAVPGIHVPVTWDGMRYVDGGMASATHLDVLPSDLDLIIVSSPLSMFSLMGRSLRREAKRLGPNAPIVLIEPDASAREVMGRNPMALDRGAAVATVAYESTMRALERGFGRERFIDCFGAKPG